MVKTGTWRKRGALKLKRKYDLLKRELNASRHPVVSFQSVRTERITAVNMLPIWFRGDGTDLPWHIRRALAEKIADSLMDADAIRFESDGSKVYGQPIVRASLDFVRR